VTLAVSTMSPEFQAVFFLIAVVLFVVAAWLGKSLMAAGLAFFAFVFFWNALAAS
jgi:hypothetical protein